MLKDYKLSFILIGLICAIGVGGNIFNRQEAPSEISFVMDYKDSKTELTVNSPKDYNNAIKKFVDLDQKGKISYSEGVSQRIACAERVSKILKIIEPEVASKLNSNKNLADLVYLDLKKSYNSKLTNNEQEIKNLGLSVYYNSDKNGEPTDIGHIGIVFRDENGVLREFSNSSSFKTKIHSSFKASTEWYSGNYSKSAMLPIK